MAGNIYGKTLQIVSFGESHGKALGVVVDGCPAGISLKVAEINAALARRKPGQNSLTSPRQESDIAEILSGVYEDKTLGSPITVVVYNHDQKSADYEHLRTQFRQGHADQVYQEKYGHRDHRGGGRSSGRETIARVIAGVIATKILPQNLKVIAHTKQVGDIIAQIFDENFIEQNSIRTADKLVAGAMESYILDLKEKGDSIGALIEIIIENCPKGLGEPTFDKIKADLAKGIMSIGAVTGISYGAGFETSKMTGTEYTNNPDNFGGILGGITTGEKITLSVSVKPTSTIGENAKLGRHDPLIATRIIPVLEAMVQITLADHYLRNQISNFSNLNSSL